LGKKSGVASVQAKMTQLGMTLSPEQLKLVLLDIKNEALRTKRPVGDHKLREFAAAALAKPI